MQAILMVGEQRSGSNLLRLILNASPQIAAPHPPHILQHLMPLVEAYGDLQDEDRMAVLVDDVCHLVENNPVPWDRIGMFDRKQVRSLCRQNSLVAVFAAVMQLYAEQHQADAWLCKSMQNIRWARELNDYLYRPKFIYLFRDPRDVALSFSRAVIGDKHPYHVTSKWAELQRLCLAAEKFLPPDQFLRVRYEALIREPEHIVRDICRFLDIEFRPSMLEFHRSQEANRTASQSTLWENLTRPMMCNNSRKFLQDMPRAHIRIIESIAGDLLDRLGYPRYQVKAGEENRFSPQQIEWFNMENELAKNCVAGRADPDDLRRRQRQQAVLQQIRQTLSKETAMGAAGQA